MDLSLLGLYLLEKDTSNDTLWTWIYPKLETTEKSTLAKKCKFNSLSNLFIKIKTYWYYIKIKNDTQSKIFNVTNIAFIIKSNDYNPRKYDELTEILSNKYLSTGNPVEIQKLYWEIYTGNICTDNGLLKFKKSSLNTIGPVKDLIKLFDLETILIYNALLLKRKVLIFHHDLDQLVTWIKAIPHLLAQRNPQDYLLPHVEDLEEDLMQIKSSKWFVAGTTSKAVCAKTNLFDLIVNIPEMKIEIMPNAKETFLMTKMHKEIAMLMVELSKDTQTADIEIEMALSDKTNDILVQLKTLGTIETENSEKLISLDNLRSKKLNINLENFLFNLALAENIMML